MRDIIVALFFLASLPVSLFNPVHGVLIYALVSYLNPHRMAWGFAREMPIAFGIAVATLIGFVFYKGDKKLPRTSEIYLVILFWLLASLGWLYALNPEGHIAGWNQFSKILLMVLLTVCLIKTRKDIRLLYMIIVFSMGFFIIKGRMWGLRGVGGAGL